MSVYTVHAPPPQPAYAAPDPERFVFVRDGFYFWAFLLTPFWLLRHRLWLALAVYIVMWVALDFALRRLGASGSAIALVGLLVSLLIGFEGGTLRRFGLSRRRWRNIGIVAGANLESAEHRFFDGWVRFRPVRPADAPAASGSAAAGPVFSSALPGLSGVIGLFPEPGGHR